MLPSVLPRLATDSAVRVFPGVWKLLSFKTPFLGRSSIPTSFVSRFVFFIFSYLLSKKMGCFSGCLMSSAGVQKLFCGIYSAFKCSFDEFVGEKVVSPSYSLAILGPPPSSILEWPEIIHSVFRGFFFFFFLFAGIALLERNILNLTNMAQKSWKATVSCHWETTVSSRLSSWGGFTE